MQEVVDSIEAYKRDESAMADSDVSGPIASPLDEPRQSFWQVPFAMAHLLGALLAFRLVFEEPPWRRELQGILDRFRSVTDEVRAHDGLQPVNWPPIELA